MKIPRNKRLDKKRWSWIASLDETVQLYLNSYNRIIMIVFTLYNLFQIESDFILDRDKSVLTIFTVFIIFRFYK